MAADQFLTPRELFSQAMREYAAGNIDAAEAFCHRMLEVAPGHPLAVHYLGLFAYHRGDRQTALRLMERAAGGLGSSPECLLNLARVRRAAGQDQAARQVLERALQIRPGYCDAQAELAELLAKAGEIEQAMTGFEQCIRNGADNPRVLYNAALAMQRGGHNLRAAQLVQMSLAAQPANADALALLGSLEMRAGHLTAAMDAYSKALDCSGNAAEIHGNIGQILWSQGKLDQAIESFRTAIGLKGESAALHSNLVYSLWFSDKHTPAEIFAEHELWEKRHAQRFAATVFHGAIDRHPQRRLRLGYVSPQFRGHSVGRLIEPLLACHDHRQFHVTLYSDVLARDTLTDRLYSLVDQTRLTAGLNDEQMAGLIAADGIDLLVDLNQHMSGSRLGVFARKPAPLQFTYLGYCATTGLRTIDYCLTDRYLDPPNVHSAIHTERPLHLPGCYWAYAPPAEAPSVGPSPCESRGHVTFGSFNTFAKVTPSTLDAWAEILRRVDGSELLAVIAGGAAENAHVHEAFVSRGVNPDRVRLFPYQPPRQYLAMLGEVDLALDPFPYAGGTSTLDSLYMGTPVVTLAGQVATARAGVTILTHTGMAELIAPDVEGYVRIVVDLALDRSRLARLRQSLRPRLLASSIADARAFAVGFENTLRRVWHEYCNH